MCKAIEYFEEMKKCNQLDYGEQERIKCKTIESNLKFAYDTKRLLAKYDIESLEGLEEIIKDYDYMAKDVVEMMTGRKVDIKQ